MKCSVYGKVIDCTQSDLRVGENLHNEVRGTSEFWDAGEQVFSGAWNP